MRSKSHIFSLRMISSFRFIYNFLECRAVLWLIFQVFDKRHVRSAQEMFEAICEHLEYATNGGKLRLCLLEGDHFYLPFYHLSQKCSGILMLWYFHVDVKHIIIANQMVNIFRKLSLLDITSDKSRLLKVFHRELSIILSHVSVTSNDRWVVIVKWSVT